MGLGILLSFCNVFAIDFAKSRISPFWKFYISFYGSILLHIKAHWFFFLWLPQWKMNYSLIIIQVGVTVLHHDVKALHQVWNMAWTD